MTASAIWTAKVSLHPFYRKPGARPVVICAGPVVIVPTGAQRLRQFAHQDLGLDSLAQQPGLDHALLLYGVQLVGSESPLTASEFFPVAGPVAPVVRATPTKSQKKPVENASRTNAMKAAKISVCVARSA